MTRLRQRPTLVIETPDETPKFARKPRLMIAGEFSAGKTRLINGLLGEDVLPSNVTATALPPVWITHDATHGAPQCYAVDHDGVATQISAPHEADLGATQFCVLSHSAQVLQHLDIIDTPGSSDPNMPAESWQNMLDYADRIVWCSNATQAWRQSEKSVWTEMPERLLQGATLLITHADRMPDARSADRVLRRVRRDASGCFEAFLMESLLDTAALGRIRRHLVTLVGDIEDMSGKEVSAMTGFPQSARRPSEPASEGPQDVARIAPRRVRRGKEASPEVSEAQPGEEATQEPAKDEPAGPARTLWRRMSQDVDLTQPQDILRCLDRVLTVLDSPKTERFDPKTQSKDSDPANALIQRLMSRRKP